MTTSFSVTKSAPRVGFALAACLTLALVAGPVRAEDKVLAKVNGSEIRQSDLALAEEELGPSLAQMDPATKDENVLSFLIDMKIVSKAAEDKKVQDTDDFKKRFTGEPDFFSAKGEQKGFMLTTNFVSDAVNLPLIEAK